MSADQITALTQLVVSIATLLTAAVAVIKAIEAKSTAASVEAKQEANHAATTVQLAEVKTQTNGILSTLAPAVAANTAAVETMASSVHEASAAQPVTITNPEPVPVTLIHPEKGGGP